jgi:hypothetical protein
MNAPQPPYSSPGPGQSSQQSFAPPPKNGMGTAALVLGILAIVLAFIPIVGFFSYPLAVLGIVFGLVGVSRAKKRHATNKGVAISGLIASVVGFVLVIISTVIYFGAIGAGVKGVTDATNAVHHLTYRVSSTNGGKVSAFYDQGKNASGQVVGVPSPWSIDVNVTGISATLSASSYTDIGQDFNRTDGLSCSIIDRDTGKTISTNSVPPSANAHVSCHM